MLVKVLLLSFVFLLTGCNLNNNYKYSSSIVPKTMDSILIYDIYNQKIVSYNLESFELDISPNMFKDNFFQFPFINKNNYFTSGHYLNDNNFEFIKINHDKKSIDVIYSLSREYKGIVPLATNNEKFFFIKYDYTGYGLPTAIIVEFKNGKLYEFSNTMNFMDSGGIIIEDYLYYTVYNVDTDSYTLYSINFLDYSNIPVAIKHDLLSGDIFLLNNEVYVSNRTEIYSLTGESSFNKALDNFYNCNNNLLIQLDIGVDGNGFLVITHAQTGEQVIVSNAIGFDIYEENIVVYCKGKVETIDLSIFT